MRIEVAGSSHAGMKRTQNEDTFLLLPAEHLYCVADGMGGHASGEVASQMAIDEIAEFFRLTTRDRDTTWPYKMDKSRNYDENRLIASIKIANARIFDNASQDEKYQGMGTTLASIHFAGSNAYIGHVGDSRVYALSGDNFEQLTVDHSLLNDYLKTNSLTPEEIEAFPHKNVIVRALGIHGTVQVDIRRIQPKDGDLFLLCSDGLTSMVEDAAIRSILMETTQLEPACSRLINLANAAGGMDNVTCVLARYHS